MRLIKSRNTKTEVHVRLILRQLGARYRLHYSKLPGKPDFAFPGRRKIVWVHGCFWHRHKACRLARLPKTRREFWIPKLEGNRQRDLKNERRITELDWQFLIIWECELQHPESVKERLRKFLEEA